MPGHPDAKHKLSDLEWRVLWAIKLGILGGHNSQSGPIVFDGVCIDDPLTDLWRKGLITRVRSFVDDHWTWSSLSNRGDLYL